MSYKLLLVDDERFMISYLHTCVDWEALQVEIVGDAGNGAEAIELTRLYQPDLVITDIVMPNMYGLEFIKNIYSQFKGTKIIILSGHQNFEFAKEALTYGVVDYIVKPSLTADIEAAVKKAIAAIEEERQYDHGYQKALNDLKNTLPDIKKSFFALLTSETAPDREILPEKARLLHIPLQGRSFYCLKVLFLNIFPAPPDNAVCQEILRTLQPETPASCEGGVLLFSDCVSGSCLGLFSLPAEKELDPRQLVSLISSAGISRQVRMVIAVSSLCDRWEEIPLSFQQVTDWLQKRPCTYSGQVITDKTVFASTQTPFTCEKELFATLEQASEPAYLEQLEIIFQTAVSSQLSMEELRGWLRRFLWRLDSLMTGSDGNLSALLARLGRTEAQLLQEENLLVLSKALRTLGQEVIRHLSEYQSAQYPNVISQALKYINIHYQDNFTVGDLARQLYLTPNYLSNLFKKHTGTSISEYITQLRIQKAKELMSENCDIKAYEVANLIGYGDYEHFRKVFKKYVGINPAKYKAFH